MNVEYWIEIPNGYDTDHYPKYRYKHNSCGGIVEKAYPFCPYCAKEINHINLIKDDLYNSKVKMLTFVGFSML